ncbi:hypothetical protein HDV00_005350 [Rhizophlyctis rosea]|nr:hypothetical protein HDV00_005350 [Rhizophlyctis rosea]
MNTIKIPFAAIDPNPFRQPTTPTPPHSHPPIPRIPYTLPTPGPTLSLQRSEIDLTTSRVYRDNVGNTQTGRTSLDYPSSSFLENFVQGHPRILITIHGYYSDIDVALLKSAKLHTSLRDLPAPLTYPYPVMAFIWPSAGLWQKYRSDETAALEATQYLATFLFPLLAEAARAERGFEIDIVAHSLGARIMLAFLREFHTLKRALCVIKKEDPIWQNVAKVPDGK